MPVVQQQLLGLRLGDIPQLRMVRLDEPMHNGWVIWDNFWPVWVPSIVVELVLRHTMPSCWFDVISRFFLKGGGGGFAAFDAGMMG